MNLLMHLNSERANTKRSRGGYPVCGLLCLHKHLSFNFIPFKRFQIVNIGKDIYTAIHLSAFFSPCESEHHVW